MRTTVYDLVRQVPFPAGIADRVLRNTFNAAWQGRDDDIRMRRQELQQQLDQAAQRGDADVADISAGVAAGLIWTVEPARAIVEQVVRDAEQILRERYATLLRAGNGERSGAAPAL